MSDEKRYGWWSDTYLNNGYGTVWYEKKGGGKVEVCWVGAVNTSKYRDVIQLCEVGQFLSFGRPDTTRTLNRNNR